MKTRREWIPDDVVSDFIGMVFILTLFAGALALGFVGLIALMNAPGATMPLPGQAPEACAVAKEAEPMPTTEDDLLYNRRATVIRVVDGDTVDTEVDFGCGITLRPAGKFKLGRFRLYGINAPESRRPPGITDAEWEVEKVKGDKAKARMTELLPMGKMIYVQMKKPDKYGRWLCTCWTSFADFGVVEKSVNAQMLSEGLAKANSYGDEPLLSGGGGKNG